MTKFRCQDDDCRHEWKTDGTLTFISQRGEPLGFCPECGSSDVKVVIETNDAAQPLPPMNLDISVDGSDASDWPLMEHGPLSHDRGSTT